MIAVFDKTLILNLHTFFSFLFLSVNLLTHINEKRQMKNIPIFSLKCFKIVVVNKNKRNQFHSFRSFSYATLKGIYIGNFVQSPGLSRVSSFQAITCSCHANQRFSCSMHGKKKLMLRLGF